MNWKLFCSRQTSFASPPVCPAQDGKPAALIVHDCTASMFQVRQGYRNIRRQLFVGSEQNQSLLPSLSRKEPIGLTP